TTGAARRLLGGQLRQEFLQEGDQELRIKDAARFRERTERDALDPQAFLHDPQRGGHLQTTQRLQGRVHDAQQDQASVVRVQKLAIAGGIAFGAGGAEPGEQAARPLQQTQMRQRPNLRGLTGNGDVIHELTSNVSSLVSCPTTWRKSCAEREWDEPAGSSKPKSHSYHRPLQFNVADSQ